MAYCKLLKRSDDVQDASERNMYIKFTSCLQKKRN